MIVQSERDAILRQRTLLVVDDEEPNRQLLSALLSAQGFRVLTARDGPSALKLAEAGGIDVVLLDVMMPVMDGMEVCRRLREELALHELIIVFVTALSDRDSRVRARAAGADDFLVKPVDSFELAFRASQWVKLGTLHDLSEIVTRLSHNLVEVSEAAKAVSSQVAEAALACHGAQSAAQLDLPQLEQRLSRSAEQLSQISADARLAAAAAESSRAALQAPVPQRASTPPRNQQS